MQTRNQKYHADMQAMIDTHGWMVQAVFSSKEGPSFAYTVGLAAKGLPEIITFSMPPEMARVTLNVLAHRLTTGETIQLDTRLTDIFHGADTQLIKVDRDLADKYMFQALYRAPDYRALQLVWSDPAMLFPWDEGYAAKFIPLQPVLRHTTH